MVARWAAASLLVVSGAAGWKNSRKACNTRKIFQEICITCRVSRYADSLFHRVKIVQHSTLLFVPLTMSLHKFMLS